MGPNGRLASDACLEGLLLMNRSEGGFVQQWWAAKKEFVYGVAIMAGIPLFLIFAAPYCC